MQENARNLKRVLEIARKQRAFLARGDLEAVQSLQETRQQLLDGIQSLDGVNEEAKATVSDILNADREIRLLLSSELADIQRKMKRITSLKRLFHTRRNPRKGTPRYVSRRI